jgi:hypothetical protein
VTFESRSDLPTGHEVPESDLAVAASGGEKVRALETDSVDRTSVPGEGVKIIEGLPGVDEDRSVL